MPFCWAKVVSWWASARVKISLGSSLIPISGVTPTRFQACWLVSDGYSVINWVCVAVAASIAAVPMSVTDGS
ncbi:Uncharacterised protein [Mycobacterium tuberculosis]|nr:Uncharacterised protein [Mycobacterium tuberculosis]